MFNNGMCLVCHDVTKFNTKLNDVRRIDNYLKNRINGLDFNHSRTLSLEERKIVNQIAYDKTNIHFMCGVCHKVNTMELKIAENRLKDTFILAIRAIKSVSDEGVMQSIKCDILRALQGYYPMMYRVLSDEV
ncbi:hypothetical protein [Clostridium disporicum]|uniref:hypothetical protein n=1 Tax=Clostridium disporicum TaxID=84024 RepID=UPI0034A4C0A4